MRSRILIALMAVAAAAPRVPARAAGAEPTLNPHTREGCLHCHKGGPGGPGLGRTVILPSTEEPHAVVAGSCRSCHKDLQQDFWLLMLPSPGGRPAAGSAVAAPPPAGAPAAEAPAPAEPVAAGPSIGGGEGFENSHDARNCADCHDKPAAELKPGSATPARFASQGVDAFCRTCHADVDRSHYPRANVPRQGTTCLNCHRVHGRALFFPSLRDDFPQFLADSADIDPHGGKIFCLACHPDTPQAGSTAALRYPGDSLRLCQRCHQGIEHHPLGVKSAPATWKMDFSRFPLENDSVVCITCHDPPECLGAAGGDNPRFLRGGPYNTVEEFCQRCHEGKTFSSLNPHDQVDPSGQVYEKKCLYCHVTVPSTSAGGDGLSYTDTRTALCISCHPASPHPNIDHLVPMTKTMLKNLAQYEEQRMVRLPLDDNDAVTCTTCHNPHERGLLKGPAGIGADEEHRLRLTTYSEQCSPCHGRH